MLDGQAGIALLKAAEVQLSNAADMSASLTAALSLLVPDVCHQAMLHVRSPADLLSLVAVTRHGEHAAHEALALELSRRFAARVLEEPSASGGSSTSIVHRVNDELLQSITKDPEQLRLLQRFDLQEIIVVPVRSSAAAFGLLLAGRTRDNGGFGDIERSVLELLASRVGSALEAQQLRREAVGQLALFAQLQAASARLAGGAVLGVLEWNRSGRVVNASEALLHLAGETHARMVGGRVHVEQLFAPSALLKSSPHETVRTLECQLLALDCAPISVLLCAAHAVTPQGHSLALVLGAATLNVQLQLDALIIGVVSHELRTPLSVIGLAANLLMSGNDVTPAQARTLKRLDTASRHCNRLVGDLLDFTAARGSGIKLVRAERDLHAITEQALENVRATWPGRDVAHERIGVALSWLDADRVSQMVVNLVNNALQHSPPATKVLVQTRGEPDAVVLTVTNSGPPIPAELMSQLFSPLRRGEDAGQRRGSLGLGLFIVRHLVIAHGGTVDVVSNRTDGTRFTISIPRLRPTAAESAEQLAQA